MTQLASRSQLRMSFLRYALVTVPLMVLLGTVSGRLAGAGHGNRWFDALAKPDLMPPGWAFGPAWTLLYVLLGLSLAVLLHAKGARGRERAVALFVLQLVLTYAWPPVFFAWHQPSYALSMLAAMAVLAVTLILLLWPIRRVAALLLLPCLAWLLFALALTFKIVALNPNAAELAPQPASTDIVL
jgi:benzodiazapine receptor